MKVYLDYAATTPLSPEVKATLKSCLDSPFGNPSSPHRFGQEARIRIEQTRDLLAQKADCLSKEIVFTSGGSESNNLALIGAAQANRSRGNHIIVSATEHPSVLESVKRLALQGFEISVVSPNCKGYLNADDVASQIRSATILVSVMFVNNETGAISPVSEIAACCQAHGILFHTDAVQAFGKIPFSFRDIGADFLSLSGHKIYAPKGCGALIIRQGTSIETLLAGGGQEANRRAGTENLLGIMGMGAALESFTQNQNDLQRITSLRDFFESNIKERFPFVQVIAEESPRSPFISNVSLPGLDNESIMLNLDLAGIAVSVGSACSSGSIKQSHVLKAMNLPDEVVNGAIRFSFGRYTTIDEIEYLLVKLEEIIGRLKNK